MSHGDHDLLEGDLEDNKTDSNGQPEEEKIFIWESLALKEFPVRIAGEEYVLVETSSENARKWRANNLQSLTSRERGKGKTKESQISFLESLADSQILLVSLCLHKIVGDKKVLVGREVIKTWPNELVENLFKRAQTLSGLRDLEEDEDDENGKDSTQGNSPPKRIPGAG